MELIFKLKLTLNDSSSLKYGSFNSSGNFLIVSCNSS